MKGLSSFGRNRRFKRCWTVVGSCVPAGSRPVFFDDPSGIEAAATGVQTQANEFSNFFRPRSRAHAVDFLSCMLTASLFMHWQSLVLTLTTWQIGDELIGRDLPLLGGRQLWMGPPTEALRSQSGMRLLMHAPWSLLVQIPPTPRHPPVQNCWAGVENTSMGWQSLAQDVQMSFAQLHCGTAVRHML